MDTLNNQMIGISICVHKLNMEDMLELDRHPPEG